MGVPGWLCRRRERISPRDWGRGGDAGQWEDALSGGCVRVAFCGVVFGLHGAVAALLLCVVGRSVLELGVGRVRGLRIWSVVSSFVFFLLRRSGITLREFGLFLGAVEGLLPVRG